MQFNAWYFHKEFNCATRSECFIENRKATIILTAATKCAIVIIQLRIVQYITF